MPAVRRESEGDDLIWFECEGGDMENAWLKYPTRESLQVGLELAESLSSTQQTQFRYMLNMHDEIDRLKAERDMWMGRALSNDTAGEYHTHVMQRNGDTVVCKTCGEDFSWESGGPTPQSE